MNFEDITEEAHDQIRGLTYELIRVSAHFIQQNNGEVVLSEGQITAQGHKERLSTYESEIEIRHNGSLIKVDWLFGNAFVVSSREAREQLNLVYLVDGRHSETMAIEGSVKDLIDALVWATKEFESLR